MPIEVGARKQALQLWKLLADATSWRECAPRLAELRDFLGAAESQQWQKQLPLEKFEGEERRIAEVIRRLLIDVQRAGLTDALSQRTRLPPLLEQWQALEGVRGGDEIYDRWEALVRHPDMELQPLPLQAETLNHAARAYMELGPTPKIALAIEKWEQAIAVAGDDALGASYRINLGTILRGVPGAARRSVELLRDALFRMPPNDSRHWEASVRLAKSLQYLFDEHPEPSVLQELIRLTEQAFDLNADAALNQLSEVSVWMYRKFERSHDIAMLDGAIELTHLALQRVPETSPSRSAVLGNLGSAYASRFAAQGDVDDLDRAIALFGSAIHCANDSRSSLDYQGYLGQALMSRHEHFPDPELVERAVALLEHVATTLSPSDAEYPHALNRLATALDARGGDPQRAIDLWEQAAMGSPTGSRETLGYRYNVAVAKRSRFERSHDPEDLIQAEEICRELMTLASDPVLAANLRSELSNVMLARSRMRRDPRLLDEAIELAEQSTEIRRSVGADYLSSVSDWSQLLFNRYEQTRSIDDLRASLHVAQAALDCADGPAAHKADLLAAAGRCLSELWEVEGDSANLDHAIEFVQTAVDSTPPGSNSLPSRLNSLAMVLRSRFSRTNRRSAVLDGQRVSDLDRAINAAEQAARAAGPQHAQRTVFLCNLSALLSERASLAKIFAHVRSELALTVAPHAMGSSESIGRADDETRALEYSAAAAAGALPGTREQFMALTNHSIHLHAQYRATHDHRLLDESIVLLERAQQMVAQVPWGGKHALALASALEDRYLRDGHDSDHMRATELLRHAISGAFPTDVVSLAQALGSIFIQHRQWADAIEALDMGIAAARQLLSVQSLRSDNESWLQETHGLWKLAAYARAKHGDLEGAVVILEEGLARHLRESLQMRTFEGSALRAAGHGEVAARHLAAIEAWDRVTRETHTMDIAAVRRDDIAARLRSARREVEDSINAIRCIPGFERFKMSLSAREIRDTARSAAIAFLVSIHHETFAIIVPAAGDEPLRYLPLSAATPSEVMDARGYWTAYLDWSHAQEDSRKREDALRTLDASTRWLWDAIMGPLIEALSPDRRATLVLTGHLSLLPLHAAWTEDSENVSGRRYAQDLICFTHAASAGTLAISQDRSIAASSDRLVAVADPRPTAAPILAHADIEMRAVARGFGCTVLLRHEGATKSALLAALRDCDTLHFCGHGFAQFTSPLLSGLMLANDETLTLGEILQFPHRTMSFAFLSACETGVVGLDLPDESVGLPSGLLLAGVAGVCASLWPVPEDSTMLLCSRFYQLWRTEGLDSAVALRNAAAWVRDLSNRELAAFFEAEMQHPDVQDTASYDLAADRWAHYSVQDPHDRPFSHPFYWAAFTFSGASIAGKLSKRLDAPAHDDFVSVHSHGESGPITLPAGFQLPTDRRRQPSLADAQELQNGGDREGLLRILRRSSLRGADVDGAADEIALLTATARALALLGANADLDVIAHDGPLHEVSSIIAAQILAEDDKQTDRTATLRTLALDARISHVTRLMAAQAIGRLGSPEEAIHLVQTIAQPIEAVDPIRSTAARLICEFAEIGLWGWSVVFGNQAVSLPELGITETLETTRQRALAYYGDGNFEMARQQLTKAISNGDRNPVTLFNRGMISYRLNRNDEAIVDFTAAIAGDARYEKAYSQRGVAYAALYRHELAIDDFTRAIKLNREDSFNYAQRARSYQALGRLALAREDTARASALKSTEQSASHLVVRQSSEQRQTPLPRAAALAALKAIDAIETIASILMQQAIGSTSLDARRLAIEGLAALDRRDELKHIAADTANVSAVRIEALMNLRPLGSDTAHIAESISADNSAAREDRELAIAMLAEAGELERLKSLLRLLGDICDSGDLDERTDSACVAGRAVMTLYQDKHMAAVTALAHDLSLPPFVLEIVGECLWGLGMPDEATQLLARIVRQSIAPASVRWSAIHALDQFDRLDAIEPELHQINLPSRPDDELKRRVRSLLLARPAARQAELKFQRDLEDACRALMDASSSDELEELIDRHPILLDPNFADYADMNGVMAADEQRRRTRLAWHQSTPRVQAVVALIAFFAAGSPEAMRQAANQHPIMPSEGFAEHVQRELKARPHGDRQANELRLKWLLELPRTTQQQAFDAVNRCPDQAAMQSLAKRYPFIRTQAFIHRVESLFARLAPHNQEAGRQRLEWLRSCALGEVESEVARAMTLHYQQHRTADALAAVTRVIESEPEYAKAWFTRGVILGESGDHAAALPDLTRSVQLDASVALAHQVRAKCLFHLGHDLEAIISADEAIGLDAAAAEPYEIRAMCRFRRKEWSLAEQDLTRSIEHGNDDWSPLFSRASCRVELGRKEEALVDLDKVLESQPDLTEALIFKATLLRQLGREGEARRYLTELRSRGATRSQAYALLYEMVVLAKGEHSSQMISALWQVDSPDDMAQLASVFPLLLDEGFYDYAEAHVVPRAASQGLPPLGQRLDWLRELPDHVQDVALWCFWRAETQRDICEAAARYPQLASPDSIRQLESTITSAPIEALSTLREKIEWLRSAPIPEDYGALFAFDESRSLEDLQRAMELHPILYEREFRDSLRHTVDSAPGELRAELKGRLALLDQLASKTSPGATV